MDHTILSNVRPFNHMRNNANSPALSSFLDSSADTQQGAIPLHQDVSEAVTYTGRGYVGSFSRSIYGSHPAMRRSTKSKSFNKGPRGSSSQSIHDESPPTDAHLDSIDSADNLAPPPPYVSPVLSHILPDPDEETADISRPDLSSEYHDIFAIPPSHFERCTMKITTPREYRDLVVKPLTTSFTPTNKIPAGWTPFTHPEGALYFFHEQKKILTDADMYDCRVCSDITIFIGQIEDFIRAHHIQLGPDVELVLHKGNYGDRVRCGYYFADHQSRSIFWLDTFKASLLAECHQTPGMTAVTHLKHQIESQYWYHCELFPHTRDVSKKLVDELRDLIIHAIGDILTLKSSAASSDALGLEDLQAMLNLVDSSERNVGTRLGGSACTLSRLMNTIVCARFPNSRGRARASLYRDRVNRSYVTVILSSILFNAPDVHLRTLEKLQTDQIVHDNDFNQMAKGLNIEWQEFSLYGTVMLNANVAFLAIQDGDSNSYTLSGSPAQIAAYLSTITATGSIILGVLLLRQNRTNGCDDAEGAMKFLKKWSNPTRGLETLAVMYSLPYALLMWAGVSFLAAFTGMIFRAPNHPPNMLDLQPITKMISMALGH